MVLTPYIPAFLYFFSGRMPMLDMYFKNFCWLSKLVLSTKLLASKELCRNYRGLLLHRFNMDPPYRFSPNSTHKTGEHLVKCSQGMTWAGHLSIHSSPILQWERDAKGRGQVEDNLAGFRMQMVLIYSVPFSHPIGSVTNGTVESVDLSPLCCFSCAETSKKGKQCLAELLPRRPSCSALLLRELWILSSEGFSQ